MIRRRALLLGLPAVGVAAAAGVVGAVESGALPGRTRLDDLLGRTGTDGVIPRITPGAVESGTFVSRHRGGARTGWSLMLPPDEAGGRTGLPLVVALHGRGGTHDTAVHQLGMPQFLAQGVAGGMAPFAVVSVDGGDSYWHPHDGSDSGAASGRLRTWSAPSSAARTTPASGAGCCRPSWPSSVAR